MKLYFDPQKLPRTIDRREWRELHRWQRLTKKELIKHEEELVQKLKDPAYGHARNHIIDELVYPPLLFGPYMELTRCEYPCTASTN
jgi:hypothetical protein